MQNEPGDLVNTYSDLNDSEEQAKELAEFLADLYHQPHPLNDSMAWVIEITSEEKMFAFQDLLQEKGFQVTDVTLSVWYRRCCGQLAAKHEENNVGYYYWINFSTLESHTINRELHTEAESSSNFSLFIFFLIHPKKLHYRKSFKYFLLFCWLIILGYIITWKILFAGEFMLKNPNRDVCLVTPEMANFNATCTVVTYSNF